MKSITFGKIFLNSWQLVLLPNFRTDTWPDEKKKRLYAKN